MLLSEKENKLGIHKKKESKLPFAVFISPSEKRDKKLEDYKEIFTDIISDRIKQKYK